MNDIQTGRYAGKAALVTGGASGIGLAAARRLVQEGAAVAIAGRDRYKLDRAAAELSELDNRSWVLAVAADVGKISDLETLAAAIDREFGSLQFVFANAGFGIFKPFGEFTEADFDDQINTNLKSVFFTAQKAAPLMTSGGSIIINASWTPRRGMAACTLYSATKAAAGNLASSLAAALADRGIRVNAVSPGYVNTAQFNESALGERIAAQRRSEVLLSRFGRAEEIASVVAFLGSDEASYVNGQDILVDGGLVVATPDR